MLSTYVDDLTLHVVNVQPPEPIYRTLGRNHVYSTGYTETAALRGRADALIFEVRDYAQQTIDINQWQALRK